MNGLGFLVWHLDAICPIADTISILKKINAKWISLKVLDGVNPFNFVDETGSKTGNPDFLKGAISDFQNAGIEVGGWGFVYTIDTDKQARKAVEMVKLLGLSHWLIDAEDVNLVGGDWKRNSSAPAKAKLYMDNLKLGAGFPAGLCSYRYPSFHPEFPFKAFVEHTANTLNAPQVYWMFSNNPGFQTKKSKAEYDGIRRQPFIPIGASFCEHGWCTTEADIEQFVSTCKNDLGLDAWGFWDLDEAIKKPEWLKAMSGASSVEPDPQPEPEPTPEEGKLVKTEKVVVTSLNVRSSIIPSAKYGRVPGTIYEPSKVWFTISNGQPVEILDIIQDGKNTWYRVGIKQYVAKQYDGTIYIK